MKPTGVCCQSERVGLPSAQRTGTFLPLRIPLRTSLERRLMAKAVQWAP